jgi:hypothetical protein
MSLLKRLLLVTFLLTAFCSFGQKIKNIINIFPDSDTSSFSTSIGEITYFGKDSKKAKNYPSLDHYKSEKRFEILWVPSRNYKNRLKVTKEELDEFVFESKDNEFAKYPCFAFIIDQTITQFPDSKYAIYGLKFPSIVEVYKFEENEWKKLYDKEVKSDVEFGELKLQVIKEN